MDAAELSDLLHSAADLASSILAGVTDPHARGERDGQYALDLAVDGPVIELLRAEGLGVLSEEAGALDIERPLVAVLDPVDGSTNASLGIPWYATSICVVDAEGPLHSLVMNHASGDRFEAGRGSGATRNGTAMRPPPGAEPGKAVVGVNGRPPADPGWWQFRTLGAASLDLCAVADGTLHGFVDLDNDAHGVWDYLGAFLVCAEVGIDVVDRLGRELVVLDHGARRTPVAACSGELFELLFTLDR